MPSWLQTSSLAASQTKHCKPKPQPFSLEQATKKESNHDQHKKIAQIAKWQRMALLGRKRPSWGMEKETDGCRTSVAGKGHCVMYTSDGRRFEVPVAYLGTLVIAELLRMSQEEFGFVSDGRITLACDATVMEYAMCLLRRGSSTEVEKAFLSTIAVS